MKSFCRNLLFLLPVILAFGCAENKPVLPPQYVDPGAQGSIAGTGIESQDLIAATDKMVRKLLDTPEIQTHKGEPVMIGLLPVENRTRFAIDKELFTARMKALLNDKARGQLRFVARDRMDAIKKEKAMKEQGEVTSGQRRRPYGVDYFLTGQLGGLSTSTAQGKSDYMLFTFRLIDAETGEEVWEGMHELKKEGSEDAVYR
jgi:PBP1b-binding outer membrane lipoprotein LpoB